MTRLPTWNEIRRNTALHAQAVSAFGQRQVVPSMPSYECWSPINPALHKAVLRCPDSFQARKEYAKHHGIDLTDCCARAIPSELPSR